MASDDNGLSGPVPQVGVVIVTYNSAEDVGAALRSLERASSTAPQVVVVDNDSSDATLEVVRRTRPDSHVIEMGRNAGFSVACNVGARAVTADYLLFLNPDSVVDPGALDTAVRRLASSPGVGMVGGHTRYENGATNPTCCFARPTLWSTLCMATGLSSLFRRTNVFNPEGIGGWDRNSDRDVDAITGCFLLMRRDLYERLGGFDERFFMYSEDLDLGTRVKALGLSCLHLRDVGLVHHGGRSDKEPADKRIKVLTGRVQYLRKHWSAPAGAVGVLLLQLSVLTRLGVGRLVSRHLYERSRTIWRARDRWLAAAPEPRTTPAHVEGDVRPAVPMATHPVETTARMAYRTVRHIVQSARSRDFDFVGQGLESAVRLPALASANAVGPALHGCNICGWTGRSFYPNTGPGYHERAVTCPGCGCADRHRSLLALLRSETELFSGGKRVVEVAPMRGFQDMMLLQPGVDYSSFDLERHAMERGDITAMRFETGSVDYFLCFHVLEHIPDDHAAIAEIHRVLREGGEAVLQVPLDWHVAATREYPGPDPREVGHVRRYARDFSDRLSAHGFRVRHRSVLDVLPLETVSWYGLSPEPIFFASKVG